MISLEVKKLADSLVAAKVLTPQQLEKALKRMELDQSPSLVITLLQMDFLSYQIFEKFITSKTGLKSAIIGNRQASPQLVESVTEAIMNQRMVFPLGIKEAGGNRTLALGMVDPLNQETIDLVAKKTACTILPVLISLPDFRQAMLRVSPTSQSGKLEVSSADKDKLVVIRPGGGEEELITKSLDKKFQTQPSVSIERAVEKTEIPLLGAKIPKFREEIAIKLGIEAKAGEVLKEEKYTRERLFVELKNQHLRELEVAFDKLSNDGKIEALANLLIKTGVITKRDLMASAAISLVFRDGEKS
ncbi:MAG: hypothetical protein IT289_02655 [Oligoflexia bacterium]|nr:hypothetical protein [Oligoflexia bacterium]